MSQGPPQVCDTFMLGKILEYPVVSVLASFVVVCMVGAYHGYNSFSLVWFLPSLIVTLLCCLFSSLWPGSFHAFLLCFVFVSVAHNYVAT
jgi:hypothetical protein